MTVPRVYIFTDGAASGNPGPGGYGVVMQMENSSYQKEFSQGYQHTTNNRMELMAVIEGLKNLKTTKLNIVIITDSKYVCDAINKRWLFKWNDKDFKGKKNVDLWKSFLKLYGKFSSLRLEWVRGHNGHVQNERCDALAVTASKGSDLLVDVGFVNKND